MLGVVDEVEAVLEVELVVPRVPVLLELVPGVELEVLPEVALDEVVLSVVDPDVLASLVVPSVSGIVLDTVLEELSVVAVVPKVPELVETLSVEPVVTTVVSTVPDEVLEELPVLVSGPLDESEVGTEDVLGLLGDGVGVMMHLHALLTLSDLV